MVIKKKLKRRKLILKCVTRWPSTCDMLRRLLSSKDFCKEMAVSNPKLHLPELGMTLKPARKARKAVPEEHFTLGDFYGVWLKCKLEIAKMTSTEFGKLLQACLKRRELISLARE